MPNLEDLKKYIEKNKPSGYMYWRSIIHEYGYEDFDCLVYMAEKCTGSGALNSMLGHGALYSNSDGRVRVFVAIATNNIASARTLNEIFYESNTLTSPTALQTIAEKADKVEMLCHVFNKVQDMADKTEPTVINASIGIIDAVKNNKHFASFSDANKATVEQMLKTLRAKLPEAQNTVKPFKPSRP